MDRKNLLVILIVIFAGVLIYNVLYFTGVIGSYGVDTPLEELPVDPRFEVPGTRSEQTPPQPRPSVRNVDNGRAGAPRATVQLADLTIGNNWGRNPFLTPAEIWALENYRPIYETEAAAAPTGLYLSAVVLDSTGRRVAVINGDIYGVGTNFSGWELVDVWDDAVVFRIGGQRHVLRIGDPEIQLSVSPPTRAQGRRNGRR